MSDHKRDEYVSLMSKVMAITSIPSRKIDTDGIPIATRSSRRYYRQPGRGHNHDLCDSCHEGGDLLCCDTCPASFHLVCFNPPLKDENIPAGEWRCQKCCVDKPQKNTKKSKVQKKKEEEPILISSSSSLPQNHLKVFVDLSRELKASNPKTFTLDKELTTIPHLAGDEKIFTKDRTRSKKKEKNGEKKKPLAPTDRRKCFFCSKSDFVGNMKGCDFCAEFFHRDCFYVPIAPKKEYFWMCPLHAENFIDDILVPDSNVSRRLYFRNMYCDGTLNHNEVKLEFERKIASMSFYPQLKMRYENDESAKKEKTMQAPEYIAQLYKHGPKFPKFGKSFGKPIEEENEKKQSNAITKYEKKGDFNDLLDASKKIDEASEAVQILLEFSLVVEQHEQMQREQTFAIMNETGLNGESALQSSEDQMETNDSIEDKIIVMINEDNLSSMFNFEKRDGNPAQEIGDEILISDKNVVVINFANSQENQPDHKMEVCDVIVSGNNTTEINAEKATQENDAVQLMQVTNDTANKPTTIAVQNPAKPVASTNPASSFSGKLYEKVISDISSLGYIHERLDKIIDQVRKTNEFQFPTLQELMNTNKRKHEYANFVKMQEASNYDSHCSSNIKQVEGLLTFITKFALYLHSSLSLVRKFVSVLMDRLVILRLDRMLKNLKSVRDILPADDGETIAKSVPRRRPAATCVSDVPSEKKLRRC